MIVALEICLIIYKTDKIVNIIKIHIPSDIAGRFE